MAMELSQLKQLIEEGLPGSQVTVSDLVGDKNHLSATVVSEAFRGKSRVQQHQMVYGALKGKMDGADGELHALQLSTSAPD
ncbi:BolA family transcriptional regulator [Magnetospira thiophila]